MLTVSGNTFGGMKMIRKIESEEYNQISLGKLIFDYKVTWDDNLQWDENVWEMNENSFIIIVCKGDQSEVAYYEMDKETLDRHIKELKEDFVDKMVMKENV